jgi:hypothetical protein
MLPKLLWLDGSRTVVSDAAVPDDSNPFKDMQLPQPVRRQRVSPAALAKLCSLGWDQPRPLCICADQMVERCQLGGACERRAAARHTGDAASRSPQLPTAPHMRSMRHAAVRLSQALTARTQRVQEFDQALTEAKRLSARAKSLIDDYKGAR